MSWLNVPDQIVCLDDYCAPVGCDPAIEPLKEFRGTVTVSFDADVRAHCLWIWVDG
jgi:hypothetical protein